MKKSLFYNKAAVLQTWNFIKQVFSCEYEIFEDTYFEDHLRAIASVRNGLTSFCQDF